MRTFSATSAILIILTISMKNDAHTNRVVAPLTKKSASKCSLHATGTKSLLSLFVIGSPRTHVTARSEQGLRDVTVQRDRGLTEGGLLSPFFSHSGPTSMNGSSSSPADRPIQNKGPPFKPYIQSRFCYSGVVGDGD